MSEWQPIGKLLRERRLELGLTLPELSEKSGIHYSSIARVEKGQRRATADFLVRIAHPLRYSKYDILSLAGFLDDYQG